MTVGSGCPQRSCATCHSTLSCLAKTGTVLVLLCTRERSTLKHHCPAPQCCSDQRHHRAARQHHHRNDRQHHHRAARQHHHRAALQHHHQVAHQHNLNHRDPPHHGLQEELDHVGLLESHAAPWAPQGQSEEVPASRHLLLPVKVEASFPTASGFANTLPAQFDAEPRKRRWYGDVTSL